MNLMVNLPLVFASRKPGTIIFTIKSLQSSWIDTGKYWNHGKFLDNLQQSFWTTSKKILNNFPKVFGNSWTVSQKFLEVPWTTSQKFVEVLGQLPRSSQKVLGNFPEVPKSSWTTSRKFLETSCMFGKFLAMIRCSRFSWIFNWTYHLQALTFHEPNGWSSPWICQWKLGICKNKTWIM